MGREEGGTVHVGSFLNHLVLFEACIRQIQLNCNAKPLNRQTGMFLQALLSPALSDLNFYLCW